MQFQSLLVGIVYEFADLWILQLPFQKQFDANSQLAFHLLLFFVITAEYIIQISNNINNVVISRKAHPVFWMIFVTFDASIVFDIYFNRNFVPFHLFTTLWMIPFTIFKSFGVGIVGIPCIDFLFFFELDFSISAWRKIE